MRRLTLTSVTLVILIGVTGCRKDNEMIAGGPSAATRGFASGEIEASKKSEAPRSEFAELKKSILDFTDLIKKCDKRYFSDVKGERIKDWGLPVDVQRMEDLCDRLLEVFGDVLDKGAYMCPELDEFITLAAHASDQYLMLAFRSKKIGVRDKKPYIKRINRLRDELRADVQRLADSVEDILALDDEDLKKNAKAEPGSIPLMTHEVLSGLGGAVEEFITGPIKAERPTWRYSLRTADRISGRAVEMLRKRAPTDHMALAGPADALTRDFAAAVNFFTGPWYNEEEGRDRMMIRNFQKANRAYSKAAARALRR